MINAKPSLVRVPPDTMIFVAIAIATVAGGVLRLTAARGDLWLDEIWSERLVETVQSYAQIAVALPHDNNHVLNSLWLKLVGPDAAPWLVRLPAVVFGTLCAPVAARIGWRVGRCAALAAAIVFACDYAFVHFGSEARGYSGLILAILLALAALEPMMENEVSRRALLGFAAAIAFGTFSHLIMVEATALLCFVAILRVVHDRGWRLAGVKSALPIVLAAAAGTLPAFVCLVLSATSGPIHVGLSTPFSFATQAAGLGQLVQALLGWPIGPMTTADAAWMLAGVGGCVAVTLPFVPARRRILPIVGIFGLPALHAALHLPNQAYARFHLASGIVLALFAAEIYCRLWNRSRARRVLALIAALAVGMGQARLLSRFLETGRGHYGEAVVAMGRQGNATFTVFPTFAAGETAAVIRWYEQHGQRDAALSPIANDKLCATPPDWIVVVHRPSDKAEIADTAQMHARPCISEFTEWRTFPAYGLSGFDWTLWRRTPPSP